MALRGRQRKAEQGLIVWDEEKQELRELDAPDREAS
jgi:hypothetical protein